MKFSLSSILQASMKASQRFTVGGSLLTSVYMRSKVGLMSVLTVLFKTSMFCIIMQK